MLVQQEHKTETNPCLCTSQIAHQNYLGEQLQILARTIEGFFGYKIYNTFLGNYHNVISLSSSKYKFTFWKFQFSEGT